ncbi:hypothetical protein EW026_g4414 [Hermanssonia centrifuga]|uniref:Cytochrome b5 heme-binding domain-containing protein n=1 Tax=Hermanssonia centrifuga TaxID=98765 RepID=A0A4S4KLR1_9APHY|nr:hypothetical protein EW026_g4414 [Hermanssonia centrifuga]
MASKIVTFDELKANSTKDSLYILLHEKVYNVTKFLDEHPGGDEVILAEAGKDATEAFEDVGHSDEARALLPDMLVGEFEKGGELKVKTADVIEERTFNPVSKDVAVYGYMTPLKVKIIIALELSDTVVKDADVITIFKALHTAYRRSVANPFLRLNVPMDSAIDHTVLVSAGSAQWKGFKRRVDEIGRAAGATVSTS